MVVDVMPDNEMINKGLEELKALRGELEKAVKNASDEAKEGWKKLQPHLQEAEKVASDKASDIAHELGESAGELIVDVRSQLEKLRDRIRAETKG
jgi:ElaB/YqjD/DUF883 family membrane-anchored ribosome-binding protein